MSTKTPFQSLQELHCAGYSYAETIPDASPRRWVDEKTIKAKKIEVSIPADDIQKHGPEAFADLPHQFVEQMRQHASKNMFDTLDEITTKTGMVTSAGGPPSPEILLEGLKKIDLEFDSHGIWQPQTLICHPDQAEIAQEAFKELLSSPKYRKELDNLLEDKKKGWRAREANRKLVD